MTLKERTRQIEIKIDGGRAEYFVTDKPDPLKVGDGLITHDGRQWEMIGVVTVIAQDHVTIDLHHPRIECWNRTYLLSILDAAIDSGRQVQADKTSGQGRLF